MATIDSDDQTAEGDPTRLTQKYIDTRLTIAGSLTIPDLLFFAPSVAAGLVALFAGSLQLRIGASVLAIALLIAGTAAWTTDRWYTSSRERIDNWKRYLANRREQPLEHGEALTSDVHGIRRVRFNGTVERTSGRHVALLRVHPRNTALQADDERDQVAAALGRALDEDVKDIDVAFFSTTTEFDPDEVVGTYEDRAYEAPADELGDGRATAERIREYLLDVTEWYRDVDTQTHQANDWHHYAIVSAEPWEVSSADDGGGWRSRIPGVGGESDDGTAERRLHQHLADKRERVADALGGVDGLDTAEPSPRETLRVLCRHWGGRGRDTEIGISTTSLAAATGHGTPSLLAPEVWDATRSHIEIGGELARTYWLAEWPVNPDPMFLRELYTTRGIDVDVMIRCRSEGKQAAIDALEYEVADVGAEGMEREESGETSALDIDDDIDGYIQMRRLLRETTSQPWQVSAYVTVRADTEAALAHAHDRVEQYRTERLAQVDVLESQAREIERTLEGAPAETWPVLPRLRQADAFRSGAPTCRDDYHTESRVDKTTRVLGGAVGAMFPFCSLAMEESAGMDWGRNEQNGAPITADPFARGVAPHMLTIGQSRSGKTYSAAQKALRWYLTSDEHNLVVCDTQSGFHGITEFVDGTHIVIDGTRAINPLDIQPVPEYRRETAGQHINPYRLKNEEAVNWLVGLLRAQGVSDAADFSVLISEVLDETYRRAGILPHDLDSHANPSPTIGDFIDVLAEVGDSPGRFSISDLAGEAAKKRERVETLLTYLAGFREDGKYHHLTNETAEGLLAQGTDMAYLDLQQLQGKSDAEASIMLHLLLGQVSQFVKRADGKTVFLIDEAHLLLHSDEMVSWLEKAAREWARFGASLFFCTQSPREFVSQAEGKHAGEENKRQTIVDQCSTMQFFRTPTSDDDMDVTDDTLRKFGLNSQQREFVKQRAVPGKAGRGYSESLVHFEDKEGWIPLYIQASPLEHHILTYQPSDHGAFLPYLHSFARGVDAETAPEQPPNREAEDATTHERLRELRNVSSPANAATDGGDDV